MANTVVGLNMSARYIECMYTFDTIFPWLSFTPFGRPDVPELKQINASPLAISSSVYCGGLKSRLPF